MIIHNPQPERSRLGDFVNELKIELKLRKEARRGFPRLLDYAERRLGYRPDFKNPRTFNEKVMWRKIFDRNPLFPVISDKLRLRDEVRKRLGTDADDVLCDLLATTRDPDRFDFSKLPKAYVAKANHASGWNIIVPPGSEVDISVMRHEMKKWLRRSYGKDKMEWAYQPIPRRVVFEEYMSQPGGKAPDDLKVMFFDGHCEFVLRVDDRFGEATQNFMKPDWTPYGFRTVDHRTHALPEKPHLFNEMIKVGEVMAKGLDSIRVDFLFTEDRFVLNEMTLYRGSGMTPFNPPEWDRHFGDLWTLPTR